MRFRTSFFFAFLFLFNLSQACCYNYYVSERLEAPGMVKPITATWRGGWPPVPGLKRGKLLKQSKGTRGAKLVELARKSKGPAGQTQAGEERATQQQAGQDGQAEAGQERHGHDQAEQERAGQEEGVEGGEIIPAAVKEKVEEWLQKSGKLGVKRALFGSSHQDHHSGLAGPAEKRKYVQYETSSPSLPSSAGRSSS